MKHIVRPIWIELAGTKAPFDATERSHRSFTHIQKYFLREVGRTFEFGELLIIRTRLTERELSQYKKGNGPILKGIHLGGRGTKRPWWYNRNTNVDEMILFNLTALLRRRVGRDTNQAWVIFAPAGTRASAIHTGTGGYAHIPISYYSEDGEVLNRPHYFVPNEVKTRLGERGWAEGVISHELGHNFGLADRMQTCIFPFGHETREECTHLMGSVVYKFPNLFLTEEEKKILLNSPFFNLDRLT